jgi:hypothetical protein
MMYDTERGGIGRLGPILIFQHLDNNDTYFQVERVFSATRARVHQLSIFESV